ncbi:DUF5679 domain-containing protein [Nitrosopumilus sp. b3]|uniref:DUF5679 domain-containing protein n=1 Tax=Nitrosopumilus sp. b3 TaxID=2109909 RepID=UPI0021075941|nr:DUF5679 domain-containing protein [Nitrosopumilus sp. b3]
MDKWADYLISEVSYDSEHLINVALRHQETKQGITKGKPVDRLTIASDIKNGLVYITIYSGKNSWKKGHKIETFSIKGTPYLRIDGNKVKLDYLGDIQEFPIPKSELTEKLESPPEPVTEPEPPSSPRGSLPKDSTEELPQELDLAPEPVTEPEEEDATPEQLARLEQLEKQIEKLESPPEPVTEPEPPSSPRGSLPKDSTEELPQELDLAPEPVTEPEEEEATPEQLSQLNELQQQIDDLENILSANSISTSEPEEEEATPEQLSQLNELQQQIDELEKILSSKLNPTKEPSTKSTSKAKKSSKSTDKKIEQKIIKTLQKQNQKLDEIENKLHKSTTEKTTDSSPLDAYCVKCKSKRIIENPKDTTMKNGRPAIRGICSVCKCKVFRIIKKKK